MEMWQLAQRQSLPLEAKIRHSEMVIRQWYEANDGEVYIAFSGGKDSTVLLDLVRSIFPEVPAVFVDTGLEFPEIRAFVSTHDNVEIIRPKRSFKEIIETEGYPVVSKKISKLVRAVQNPTARNAATRHLAETGIRGDGKPATMMRVSAKWKYLFNAPFKISDTCCLWMKKKPIAEYVKRTGKKSFIGTMASDSSLRRTTYLRTGCNSLENGTSTPLSIWTEADVWEYLHSKNIPYCSVYDNGEQRTGCIFCMFGMVFDKQRFVRLSKTHPSLHKYCMEQLHLNTVLTYLGYPTGEAPEQEEFKFE